MRCFVVRVRCFVVRVRCFVVRVRCLVVRVRCLVHRVRAGYTFDIEDVAEDFETAGRSTRRHVPFVGRGKYFASSHALRPNS